MLDAGCGQGWWTGFLNDLNTEGEVYGIDIAEGAVTRGREKFSRNLVVGDIANLPFRAEAFDYIACEEAIHHTPDPESALNHLASHLCPGGTYTMYIYKKKPLLRETADTIIRERTTDMDIQECVEFSKKMAKLGKELYEVDEEITVPQIPTLGIEAGTYTVQEFVYRYLLKCYFNWYHEDWDKSVGNNFDWYHPRYAHRYIESEVRDMVNDAGMGIVHFKELMSGCSIKSIKST